MEIIIDIPEDTFEWMKKYKVLIDEDIIEVSKALADGKPLPQTQYWVYKQGKGWFCPECDTVGDTHFNYCPYCATPLKVKENNNNE